MQSLFPPSYRNLERHVQQVNSTSTLQPIAALTNLHPACLLPRTLHCSHCRRYCLKSSTIRPRSPATKSLCARNFGRRPKKQPLLHCPAGKKREKRRRKLLIYPTSGDNNRKKKVLGQVNKTSKDTSRFQSLSNLHMYNFLY